MFRHKSADAAGIVGRLLGPRAERSRVPLEGADTFVPVPAPRFVPREMAYPAMHFMRLVR
jgi:hypothetical protein